MTNEDLHNIKAQLPLPSEVDSEDIKVPVKVTGQYGFGAITFTKEYYKGICIGWVLKPGVIPDNFKKI